MSSKARAKIKRQQTVSATGHIPNINQFIKDNIRQVKWMYNNHMKCSIVIPEKEVYLIIKNMQTIQGNEIDRLIDEIIELKQKLKSYNGG